MVKFFPEKCKKMALQALCKSNWVGTTRWHDGEGFLQCWEGCNKRIVDLDETLTPIIKGFYQEEGIALYPPMHAPRVLDFNINEIGLILGGSKFSANFTLLFYRFGTLVLALYIRFLYNIHEEYNLLYQRGLHPSISSNMGNPWCWTRYWHKLLHGYKPYKTQNVGWKLAMHNVLLW